MIPTYYVIATHDRCKFLYLCLESLGNAELIVVIDNASSVPASMCVPHTVPNVQILDDSEQPPNLSRLWNTGLDAVKRDAHSKSYDKWNVAVVNDDIIAPAGWGDALGTAMRQHPTAVLAYGDQYNRSMRKPVFRTKAATTNAFDRIIGYAHMMRGEVGLRYDERFRWWYGDDDMDWTARMNGGTLMVPGLAVQHYAPDVATNSNPELYAQAGIDRQTFIDKWGSLPC